MDNEILYFGHEYLYWTVPVVTSITQILFPPHVATKWDFSDGSNAACHTYNTGIAKCNVAVLRGVRNWWRRTSLCRYYRNVSNGKYSSGETTVVGFRRKRVVLTPLLCKTGFFFLPAWRRPSCRGRSSSGTSKNVARRIPYFRIASVRRFSVRRQ